MDRKSGIFSKESLEKVLSPEQLDEYIKVAKPNIWIVLFAFFILSSSVIVWGFMGTLPKTLTVSGLLNADNTAVCFVSVNSLNKDIKGHKAQIITADKKSLDGTVSDISTIPYSAEEIAALQESDWLIKRLVTDDYSYAVTVKLADNLPYTVNTIVDISLIIEEVKPISFILN